MIVMEAACNGAMTIASNAQGLKDLVVEDNLVNNNCDNPTGFMYTGTSDKQAMRKCIFRAIETYKTLEKIGELDTVQKQVIDLAGQHDWSSPSRGGGYMKIYRKLQKTRVSNDSVDILSNDFENLKLRDKQQN